MGKLQTYDLVCELFEYSDEEINTGNTTIDAIESDYSQKQSIYITSVSGTFSVGEVVSQTLTLDDTLYGTAAGTATVANGAITGITLTSSGYGYSSAPAITITGGGGSNAELTAVLTSGRVTGVTVDDGGTGFTSTPTITFAAPATQTISGELLTITANTEANNAYTLQVFNVKTDNINYNNFINGLTVTGLTSNATGNVSVTTAETLPTVTQNDSFETVADNFLDFSEADPFSEGGSY